MRIVARDRDEKEGEGREAEIDSAESNREREVYIIRTNRHESTLFPNPRPCQSPCTTLAPVAPRKISSFTTY